MTYTNGQLRDWKANRGYVDEIATALEPLSRNGKAPYSGRNGDAADKDGTGSRGGLGSRRSTKFSGLRSDVNDSKSNHSPSDTIIYAGLMTLAFSFGAWSCVTALKVMAAL